MKIAVMGTGGLGGYIGGQLANAGNDVCFIARGAQLEALNNKGLEVRSTKQNFHLPTVTATSDPAEVGAVDLIIFSVKAYDVGSAIDSMKPMVGANTSIVPILNGVGHMEGLTAQFGSDHTLGGLTSMTAHVVAPGIVERIGEHGTFEFGEQAGGTSDRVETLEKTLGIDGLNGKASATIMLGIWQKFATICGANICCIVRGDKAAVMRGMPDTGDLMRQLCGEVVKVAQARSIDLPDTAVDQFMELFGSVPPHFKPSMLVGLEHGHRIELEALNGTVVRFGGELGLPTPANRFLYACLKPYVDGSSA